MAQSDAFLKIDGIQGESTDKTHPDEFDLIHWDFGVTNSSTMGTGGGAGGGKASLEPIPVTTHVGKSSPELFLRSCTGKVFPEAIITCRKAGDQPLDFLKITLKDVFISSYRLSGAGGGEKPIENWNLNYADIKLEYQAQKNDGSGEGFIGKHFNVQENVGA
ncbi:MAG: Hcp family type VI secretion system effector [Aridibacter sp.]